MGSKLCPNLATKLAALKEAYSSPQSDSTTLSDLSLFLSIYLKSEHLCCLNYMEGAEILYRWLSPFTSFSDSATISIPRIPRLFRTYEVTQLAKIISPSISSDEWVTDRRIAENMIYYILSK